MWLGVNPTKICFSSFSYFHCYAWVLVTLEKMILYEMTSLMAKKRKNLEGERVC